MCPNRKIHIGLINKRTILLRNDKLIFCNNHLLGKGVCQLVVVNVRQCEEQNSSTRVGGSGVFLQSNLLESNATEIKNEH
ncbi:hypothetical protein ACTXT7_008420 [Hymenolepis weldensis]